MITEEYTRKSIIFEFTSKAIRNKKVNFTSKNLEMGVVNFCFVKNFERDFVINT